MTVRKSPVGLGPGGLKLWRAIHGANDLDELQIVQLTEACRLKDRLDKLDQLLRGDIDTWARLTHRLRTEDYELKIDDAAKLANAMANQMKQLLAALRLPDDWGKKPQKRGAPRGSYGATTTTGKVSSLDRARSAKSGA